MAKSADAFRTISEVAEWLGSPAHVLRFWESKFTQVKPVKRAGGRRYYRPADMLLLGGIKKLLHDDGMTIKGVQKILREQGVKHVSSLSQPLEFDATDVIDSVSEIDKTLARPATADVVPFQPGESAEDRAETTPAEGSTEEAAPEAAAQPENATPASVDDASPASGDDSDGTEAEAAPIDGTPASDTRVLEDFAAPRGDEGASEDEPAAPDVEEPVAASEAESDGPAEDAAEDTQEPAPEPEVELPAFLHRAAPTPATPSDNEPAATADEESPEETTATAPLEAAESAEPEAASEPEPPRPAQIELPEVPGEDEITAPPGILSRLAARRGRPLPPEARAEIAVLRDKLAALHRPQGNATPE